MRKLDNQWKKICKEWKYYPLIFFRLPVFLSFLIFIIVVITKSIFPESVKTLLDWIGKGFLGVGLTLLVSEFRGNNDIYKLLKKLNETLYNLYKWKERAPENPVRTEDIDYVTNSIVTTIAEYSEDYEVNNIKSEIEHINKTKERIEKEEDTEEKLNLKESLMEHVSLLKQDGFNDIDSITGTTASYFSDLLNRSNRRERRKKRK
jgi:hypothetical protein